METELVTIQQGFKESALALRVQMLQLPQVECPLTHYFANGAYVREVRFPAGTLVLGEVHRHECINILLQGEITVITEEGTKRMTAPCTFVSPPLTQKAAYAHTDVVWSNVIATSSTDIEEIEREQTVQDFAGCEKFLALVRYTTEKEGLCLS